MTFKPAIWYPIAVVLSVFNLVSVAIVAEPWHATIHAVLALGFGLWAQRLRRAPGGRDVEARLEALEGEVSRQRRGLTEAQGRLHFAEGVQGQAREGRRVGPERYALDGRPLGF